MKKIWFLTILLMGTITLLGSEQIKDTIKEFSTITTSESVKPSHSNEWGIKWSGFITMDAFWDTRKPVEARDGGIFLYPSNVQLDANGIDLNDRISFNYVVMNTRLNAKITAPDALGAKISGMIEGWFMGLSNDDMNGFALRHAFIKMDWKKTQLLIGQTWHPLFTERMFPSTVTGNAGAPFQPFSRAPQFRLTQKLSKSQNIMLYCNTQRDMLSDGFDKRTSQYLRNSAIPEMGAQYIFDRKNMDNDVLKSELYFGFGFDFKRIIPRLKTEANVATNQGLNSSTGLVFFHYAKHFTAKTKAGIKYKSTYAQNTLEFLMMGGYAIKEYAVDSTLSYHFDFEYTNLNTISNWLDLYVNHKGWEFGVLTGYAQNLGSYDRIQDPNNTKSYFATLSNAAYLYRISPRIKYTTQKLQFAFEPEYTAVLYGTKKNSNGSVDLSQPTHLLGNIRFLFTTVLYF